MLDAHFTRQQALERWSELLRQFDKSGSEIPDQVWDNRLLKYPQRRQRMTVG
jgi:hypothetical protein